MSLITGRILCLVSMFGEINFPAQKVTLTVAGSRKGRVSVCLKELKFPSYGNYRRQSEKRKDKRKEKKKIEEEKEEEKRTS